MAFAPNMTVFPGGAVEPDDHLLLTHTTGPPATWWATQFGCTPHEAALFVGATIRETFEEVGVLHAAPAAHPTTWVPAADVAHARATWANNETLTELCTRNQWRINTTGIKPWARWVTPAREPRRFDATFSIAAIPPGQHPTPAPGVTEISTFDLITPHQALHEHHQGTRHMLPPTLAMLRDLHVLGTLDTILTTPRDIRIIQPDD